ncbi:MAG: DUF5076 domain-containing protein [Pseudomonadota bacterium]
MKTDETPQPFLVAFPIEDGGQQVLLDPQFFHGLDEVGLFMADLARHFARAFIQSGRARDMADAVEQIREYWDLELNSPTDDAEGSVVS